MMHLQSAKNIEAMTVVVVIVKARLLLKQTNVEMEVFH
jgi:hypothetical protein